MGKAYRRERSSTLEVRSFPIELRAAADGEKPKLTGYAAVFGRETVLVPANAWYQGSPEIREIIDRGAFAKSISQSDQRAVWNHNTDFVLGRRKNDTLRLWEDEKGLGNDIFPPDTDLVRDMVIAPIERGDVDQMSFGFRVIADSVLDEDNVITIRLKEIDLVEVSPCTLPAYTDTQIGLSARSADRIEEFRQLRQAAIQAPASDQPQVHAESDVAESETAQPGHAEAPINMRHLDNALLVRWEIEKALLSPAA